MNKPAGIFRGWIAFFGFLAALRAVGNMIDLEDARRFAESGTPFGPNALILNTTLFLFVAFGYWFGALSDSLWRSENRWRFVAVVVVDFIACTSSQQSLSTLLLAALIVTYWHFWPKAVEPEPSPAESS